jgi:TPR repeat protein
MANEKQPIDQRYADAAYAYGIGQFDEAFAGFSKLAQSGDPMATAYLAQMYLRGEGVSANVAKGLELLETAVALGNSTAAFNLGALHRSGDCDVPIDREKSKAYFRRAKELGCELSVEPYL